MDEVPVVVTETWKLLDLQLDRICARAAAGTPQACPRADSLRQGNKRFRRQPRSHTSHHPSAPSKSYLQLHSSAFVRTPRRSKARSQYVLREVTTVRRKQSKCRESSREIGCPYRATQPAPCAGPSGIEGCCAERKMRENAGAGSQMLWGGRQEKQGRAPSSVLTLPLTFNFYTDKFCLSTVLAFCPSHNEL